MSASNTITRSKAAFGILAFLVMFAVSYFSVRYFFFRQPGFEKQMHMAAEALNKSCPAMIDPETRLDNAVVLPGNIFQYNYTLINFAKEDMDLAELSQNMEPTIVNAVKTNPALTIYREHKTTMAYQYSDKNGVYLFTISVTPEKYGG